MNITLKLLCYTFILSFVCGSSLAKANENEQILVGGNSEFALNLYKKLSSDKPEENLFFSPYSISTALAMTYAGASGKTEQEMAKALNFYLPQESLHHAFMDIEDKLNKVQQSGNVKLNVANSLYPQKDYKIRQEYKDFVKAFYGVEITSVDYRNAEKEARALINTWVENKTNNKIKDLFSQPLNPLTRLILVNAIYFKGNWASQFDKKYTKDENFYFPLNNFISSKNSKKVPMMNKMGEFKFAEVDALKILELPYVGEELSMVILLPKNKYGIKGIEEKISVNKLNEWRNSLRTQKVKVSIPKFKMTESFNLNEVLKSMGMVDAFKEFNADFSGMISKEDGQLYIGSVIHKAFVEVNEEGTEAAAATAVVMLTRSVPSPPPVFSADHPFIFLIQDNATGSILFMGRMLEPTS